MYNIHCAFSNVVNSLYEIQELIPLFSMPSIYKVALEKIKCLDNSMQELQSKLPELSLNGKVDPLNINKKVKTLCDKITNTLEKNDNSDEKEKKLIEKTLKLAKSIEEIENSIELSDKFNNDEIIIALNDLYKWLNSQSKKNNSFSLLLVRKWASESAFSDTFKTHMSFDYSWSTWAPRIITLAILLHSNSKLSPMAFLGKDYDKLKDVYPTDLTQFSEKIKNLKPEEIKQLIEFITHEAFNLPCNFSLNENLKEIKKEILILAGHLFPLTNFISLSSIENLGMSYSALSFLMRVAYSLFPTLDKDKIFFLFMANPENSLLLLQNITSIPKSSDLASKISDEPHVFENYLKSIASIESLLASFENLLQQDKKKWEDLKGILVDHPEQIIRMHLTNSDTDRFLALPKGRIAYVRENFDQYMEFLKRHSKGKSLIDYMEGLKKRELKELFSINFLSVNHVFLSANSHISNFKEMADEVIDTYDLPENLKGINRFDWPENDKLFRAFLNNYKTILNCVSNGDELKECTSKWSCRDILTFFFSTKLQSQPYSTFIQMASKRLSCLRPYYESYCLKENSSFSLLSVYALNFSENRFKLILRLLEMGISYRDVESFIDRHIFMRDEKKREDFYEVDFEWVNISLEDIIQGQILSEDEVQEIVELESFSYENLRTFIRNIKIFRSYANEKNVSVGPLVSSKMHPEMLSCLANYPELLDQWVSKGKDIESFFEILPKVTNECIEKGIFNYYSKVKLNALLECFS